MNLPLQVTRLLAIIFIAKFSCVRLCLTAKTSPNEPLARNLVKVKESGLAICCSSGLCARTRAKGPRWLLLRGVATFAADVRECVRLRDRDWDRRFGETLWLAGKVPSVQEGCCCVRWSSRRTASARALGIRTLA